MGESEGGGGRVGVSERGRVVGERGVCSETIISLCCT